MEKQQLTVAGLTVKQDSEGRYCLNDFHKAAGGEKRHAPALWERQAAGIICELEKDTNSYVISKSRGRTGGTFVIKELVYAYAMWISPSFNVKVIRAYDTLQAHGVAVSENSAEDLLKNPLKYLKVLMDQAEVLQDKVEEYEPIVKFVSVNEYCSREGYYAPKSVSTRLGIRATKLAKDRGIELQRKPVHGITTGGFSYAETVNVYPIELLDEARRSLTP